MRHLRVRAVPGQVKDDFEERMQDGFDTTAGTIVIHAEGPPALSADGPSTYEERAMGFEPTTFSLEG